MLLSPIAALAANVALVGAGSASAEMGVVADYPQGTPAYASFEKSLRVFPLPDRSLAVVHLTPATAESGITATILRRDGTVLDEWRASDWLAAAAARSSGEVKLRTNPGAVGQIYYAALLPGTGELAVSIGWRDAAGRSENGIALLRAVYGKYMPEKVFVSPVAVQDVAAGPGDTIAATVFDSQRFRSTGQTPTLALFNREGKIVAEASPIPLPAAELDAHHTAIDSRLIALPGDRVAFVNPTLQKAFLVRFTAGGDAGEGKPSALRTTEMRGAVDSVVSLAPPAAALPTPERTSVRAVFVDDQQRIGVVYSTSPSPRPALTVVQSTEAGPSETAIFPTAGLRAAYWLHGRLHAIEMDEHHVVIREVSAAAPAH